MVLIFFTTKIDSGCAIISNKKVTVSGAVSHLGAGQKEAVASMCTSYMVPCLAMERDRHGP